MFESLKNKNVLVTGSTRGIGKAIAEGFAKMGANVAVHGICQSSAMENTLNELKNYDGKCVGVFADLSDPRAASKLIADTVNALGGIDILVCNVSVQIRKNWLEITDEDMMLQTEVNFFNTVRLIQKAVPLMQKNGFGRVITIGSVQQDKPHPDMLIYSANKCAVKNVVQSLALQLAKDNITVNNLAVGTIYTDRNKDVLQDAEYLKKVENDIPVGFIGEPRDCAGMALLLASEEGRYITGEDIHIDGGKFI